MQWASGRKSPVGKNLVLVLYFKNINKLRLVSNTQETFLSQLYLISDSLYIFLYYLKSKFDHFIIVTKNDIYLFLKETRNFLPCFFKEQIKILEIKVRKTSVLKVLIVKILDYFKNAIRFLGKNLWNKNFYQICWEKSFRTLLSFFKHKFPLFVPGMNLKSLHTLFYLKSNMQIVLQSHVLKGSGHPFVVQ